MSTPGKLVTVLMGEAKSNLILPGGPVEETKEGRSAPNYIGIVPTQKLITNFKQKVNDQEINFQVKGYLPDIIVVQSFLAVEDIFNETVLDIKEKMLEASRAILQKYNTYKNFEEEYGIFCVSQYKGEPEEFFPTHAFSIAALLKTEKEPLDQKEIQRTLESSIKYAKDDLLIADWDGAFIFDASGNFNETIELLEIGNLQLLKYRILDYELDRRLNKLLKLLRRQQKERFSFFRSGEIKEIVREIIQARSQSLSEFETVERNIKLIGDWYSAKVYNLLEKKFHLEEWRKNIREKFETLEDIYAMAAEHFALTFNKKLDLYLLFGWTILQIGWFVILFFDFYFLGK